MLERDMCVYTKQAEDRGHNMAAQEPPPHFFPSWEQKSSGFLPVRPELGSASDSLPTKPLGASLREEEWRPPPPAQRPALCSPVGKAASFPPVASKWAPSHSTNPPGTDSPLSVPFPADKRSKSLFSLPSPVLGEARRMPFAPPTKNSPAAPGRHRGFTHFLPAGRPVSGTSAPRLVPRQRPGPPAGPRPTPPQRVWPRHALSPSEHTRASARPDPCPARHSHRQPR